MEGEIYFVKNKINGKGYIGQALKYVSKNSRPKKWGIINRWKSHLREAELKVNENNPSWQKDRCVALCGGLASCPSDTMDIGELHLAVTRCSLF